MEPRALGQRLQEAMAVAGLSREELAQLVGVDVTILSRICRNLYPQVDLGMLEKLAQIFHCEVYELLVPVSPDWHPIEGRGANMFMSQLFHLARTMQVHEIRALVRFLRECWQQHNCEEGLALTEGGPGPDREG